MQRMKWGLQGLILSIYLTSVFVLFATGDPVIKIKLTPLAVNDQDQVLFSSRSYNNSFGSTNYKQEEFGWLVVGSDGLWDERTSYHFDNKQKDAKYAQYIKGEINLKNPDDVLIKLMKKYNFKQNSKLQKSSWVLALKPKQSCYKGLCVEHALKQKSLSNAVSSAPLTTIRSSFNYKGVALFNNNIDTSNPKSKISKGSSFSFNKKQPINYRHSQIDGIVLFNHYALDAKYFHDELASQLSLCSNTPKRNTSFTPKGEQWNICLGQNKTEVIQISHNKKGIKYQELYLLKNDKLIYAKEQEQSTDIQQGSFWNCEYRIKNNDVSIIQSLGHGKTEDESWEPSTILGIYKNRKAQLKKMKHTW